MVGPQWTINETKQYVYFMDRALPFVLYLPTLELSAYLIHCFAPLNFRIKFDLLTPSSYALDRIFTVVSDLMIPLLQIIMLIFFHDTKHYWILSKIMKNKWRTIVWGRCQTVNEISYFNYANPVYGVAAICRQVRCLRRGHPSLLHTATSLLFWYKMFCIRDIPYRLTWMKFINMLSVYAQSGRHRRVNWWIITVLT